MQKKPKSYSAALMDQIPIKYLVTQAQGLQQELGGEGIIICTFYSHICVFLVSFQHLQFGDGSNFLKLVTFIMLLSKGQIEFNIYVFLQFWKIH